MSFVVNDCSPFAENLSATDQRWLADLAKSAKQGDFVIRLEGGRDDEPIVRCAEDGRWWAGRYVGNIVFRGRSLTIRPRFGDDTLRAWFAAAFNIALVEMPGAPKNADWYIPWLLATVWSRLLVRASRHGLPALHADVREYSLSIKGSLDIPRTTMLRAAGAPTVASVRREKSLDNAISRAIVGAHRELAKSLAPRRDAGWLPERAAEVVGLLIGAVGKRPEIPSFEDMRKVRLTPITAGFREVAELSLRIVAGLGVIGDTAGSGSCRGVLVDVAEIWELYVLAAARRARPDLDVLHGTRQFDETWLLLNEKGETHGLIKPDIVIKDEAIVCAILDAKYKRLINQKPLTEDLYQMVAYLNGMSQNADKIVGLLAYPKTPYSLGSANAAGEDLWMLDRQRSLKFITLPHDLDEAAATIGKHVSTHV